MPSQLINRVRAVTWDDFGATPPPNQTHAAHIETNANLSFGFSGPSGDVRLKDVTVTIQLFSNRSWARMDHIDARETTSPGSKADLLKHEQGHYDITALMGRDLFIELMALTTQGFQNQTALQNEVRIIGQRYHPQRIHTLYDSSAETEHGVNATNQSAWDGYLERAFTRERVPAVRAPDGASYKLPLLDVLRTAGKVH